MNEKQKEREPMYNGEIWTSDKLKFSFWYPQRFYDDFYEEIKRCLSGNKNEFWFGNFDVELHLEDWEGNHYKSFNKATFSIPWDEVVMWDLSIKELN